MIRRVDGACGAVPCASGACSVICPARETFLRVDVREPWRGRIVISVEGRPVLARTVAEVPSTGLTATVEVSPARWPVVVEVRVDEQSGQTHVDATARFVVTRRAPDGSLGLITQREPPRYE